MEALYQLSYSPELLRGDYRRDGAATPFPYGLGMDSYTSPGTQGTRSEAAIASALVRSGAEVYLPAFGNNGRIDLIYVRTGAAVRVQCKSACRIGDSLRFWTCSNTANNPAPYIGEVDEFGVYSPDTGVVYVVPADGLPSRACFLRLAPTRNGQRVGVRWARDFELGPP